VGKENVIIGREESKRLRWSCFVTGTSAELENKGKKKASFQGLALGDITGKKKKKGRA